MECSPYFSIQDLFNYAASSSDYTALNGGLLNEKLHRMSKKVVMA
jgi:hypothetical protein